MSNEIMKPNPMAAIEQVLMRGDLSVLSQEQRVTYYNRVCETVGLNPLTKPFDYIELNRKLVLYANKGCAEQLRQVHGISIRITARETIEGVYVVTAQAERKSDGRVDESTGAVPISGLKGEVLANAMMKCETKAKRRVTLSICGLNMLDETEVETIEPVIGERLVVPEQPEEQDGTPLADAPFRFQKLYPKRGLQEAEKLFGLEKMRERILSVEGRIAKADQEGKPVPDREIWEAEVEEAARYIGDRENGLVEFTQYEETKVR